MFMMIKMIPLFLLLAAVGGCENEPLPSQDKLAEAVSPSDEVFVNPDFICATTDLVEPGEGYPHPFQDHPFSQRGERSIAQLEGFCQRMQEHFSESGLTVTEAARVYEAIPAVLTITDGSYGMPPDNESPRGPVVLEERVMLKKVAENRYELFFYRIGCGRHYSRYELDLTGPEPEARILERWAEMFPC
jgi:hypothetical protein